MRVYVLSMSSDPQVFLVADCEVFRGTYFTSTNKHRIIIYNCINVSKLSQIYFIFIVDYTKPNHRFLP